MFCVQIPIWSADFEGEADPFADTELKTLNDLAELRTILATDRRRSIQPPAPQINGHAAPAANALPSKVYGSVVDPKLFFFPDPDPTLQEISDLDPT